MNLDEAYELIDLLLDKADQPYFTTIEKDKFLDLAISDFIGFHYQKMTIDEDSRRALAGCIDFELTDAHILGMSILDDIYPSGWNLAHPDKVGHWQYENQYILPKRHLYTLAIGVQHYNKSEIIDSSGSVFPDKVASDIVRSQVKNIKNKSARDFYEDSRSGDPFNKPTEENASWAYVENRIVFNNRPSICKVSMQYILLPTVDETFRTDQIQLTPRFTTHYRKKIIELAVDKMTRVDVGLMTPSS